MDADKLIALVNKLQDYCNTFRELESDWNLPQIVAIGLQVDRLNMQFQFRVK